MCRVESVLRPTARWPARLRQHGPAAHVGSHHAQPGCSVEAASGLDRAAWPIGEACWRQLRRCMVWPQWTELRAGAPECKLACRQAAGSDRIYDRSGTDWRCAGFASYRTGRPNSRMRERVQYSAVGRGGCARTHLEPFSKPTEHINKHFGARERRSVRFLRSEFRLLYWDVPSYSKLSRPRLRLFRGW